MKCKECKYCSFIEMDGYMCDNVGAFIPEELIDKDIDCMVYEGVSTFKIIDIDEDGCKNVSLKMFNFKTIL